MNPRTEKAILKFIEQYKEGSNVLMMATLKKRKNSVTVELSANGKIVAKFTLGSLVKKRLPRRKPKAAKK